jgi:Transposase DDE domain
MWIDESAFMSGSEARSVKRGRPQVYSDALIQAMLTLKHVYHLTLRSAQGFVQSLRELAFVGLSVPNHTTLSRRAHDEGVVRQKNRVPRRKKLCSNLTIVRLASGRFRLASGRLRLASGRSGWSETSRANSSSAFFEEAANGGWRISERSRECASNMALTQIAHDAFGSSAKRASILRLSLEPMAAAVRHAWLRLVCELFLH